MPGDGDPYAARLGGLVHLVGDHDQRRENKASQDPGRRVPEPDFVLDVYGLQDAGVHSQLESDREGHEERQRPQGQ